MACFLFFSELAIVIDKNKQTNKYFVEVWHNMYFCGKILTEMNSCYFEFIRKEDRNTIELIS